MANNSKKKQLGDNYIHQIRVLRSMIESGMGIPKEYQITEITQRCGIGDEREVQRYLYILEGQKLVSPKPPGDFTSRIWKITSDGVKALQVISEATPAQR